MKRKSISIIMPPSGGRGAGFILRAALALGCIVLAGTGCHREEEAAPFLGGEIEFSVSTGYENDADIGGVGNPESEDRGSVGRSATDGENLDHSGDSTGSDGGVPQTRTAYSGDFVTLPSGRYERIDWVDGDRISIWCDKVAESVKRHDYSVSSHTASGVQSHAAVVPVSASPHWGAGNDFVFYAMYPAASTPGVDASKVSLNGNVMQGTIPSVQAVSLKPGTRTYVPDMKYAYMYAATTMASAGPVSLPFKPMVTAFEFTVDSWDDPTLVLYNAALWSSSHALSGDFTATVTAATGENAVCTYHAQPMNSDNNWIHVEFGAGGVTITKGQPITFTLFALPQDMTNLTMVFRTSKGERSVPLSYVGSGPIVFNACQKYRVATLGVPGKLYDFFLTVTTPNEVPYTGGTASASVQSYKVNLTTGAQTAAPWEVAGYYADPACTVPYNGNATLKPGWLTLSSYSGTGSTTGEAQNATCAASPAAATAHTSIYDMSQSFLSSAAEVGSPSRYWNLANPVDGGDYIVESANCYIVNAPGYYRIPLVVGNGVKNNAPNAVAYTAANFKDYLDANISSPYLHGTSAGIATPSYAFVIREEGGKFLDVSEETNWPLAPVPGTGSNLSITWNGAHNVYWLNFHISRANIRPATAVIGVRDTQGRIMWSWQIWVTDYIPKNYPAYPFSGLKDIPVTNRTGYVYTFMPRNLGEVTHGESITKTYNERKVYVKLVQNHSGGATAVLSVTQAGAVEHELMNPLGTHCPLYQFGRKDPIIGGNGINNSAPTFYGVWPTFRGYRGEIHSLGFSIQNPWRSDHRGYGTLGPYDWCTPALQTNWWCAGNTETGPMDKAIIKTIYDPSPAGYHVPASNAFTGFTTTGGNSNAFNQFNVKDVNGDGAVTSADYRRGWHFYTDASRTRTIYFIAEGIRFDPDAIYSGNGNIYRTAFSMPVTADNRSGCTLCMSSGAGNVSPIVFYYQLRTDCYAVRAVQD